MPQTRAWPSGYALLRHSSPIERRRPRGGPRGKVAPERCVRHDVDEPAATAPSRSP